jgi:hypothetical protein
MAIQVGGTTVIDNTPNLVNVGGLKTVGSTSILGSGDIPVGGSTTYAAVGTYIAGMAQTGGTQRTGGYTFAGSSIRQPTGSNWYPYAQATSLSSTGSASLSGTWQVMAPRWGINNADDANFATGCLFVRIS